MRITPPAGAYLGALWTAQISQVLHHAATNKAGASDTPVEAPKPVVEPTRLPPTGSHQVDIRV
jgi:hypothetical protein